MKHIVGTVGDQLSDGVRASVELFIDGSSASDAQPHERQAELTEIEAVQLLSGEAPDA